MDRISMSRQHRANTCVLIERESLVRPLPNSWPLQTTSRLAQLRALASNTCVTVHVSCHTTRYTFFAGWTMRLAIIKSVCLSGFAKKHELFEVSI
jgi:hypothetical protein